MTPHPSSLSGQRLGAYDVGPPIGVGGMGEVYRARDSKLNRDVAIKVLLPAVASDPERLARFRHEAQTLASLNHPGIAQIHGLEDSNSGPFLVMELVEGPTLADRIAIGAVPVDEALAIARQMADALEAAHERGIVHRDLKPANIKVRDDGAVKILDFGLAKALESGAGNREPGTEANSPTITSPAMTQTGMILGTAAYMSPEQAKGRVVDKRTDVWAFGCVLYEMFTGRRAFDGEDVTDTLAFVITKEPDWTALPAATPEPVRRVLRRCLQKDRKQRLADIADARIELEEARLEPAASAAGPPPRTGPRWNTIVPWVLVAAAVIALGALAPWRRPSPIPMSFTTVLGTSDDATLLLDPGNAVAISPDGRLVAFVAGNTAAVVSPGRNVSTRLYVRPTGSVEATALTGTENAIAPFFSPDGEWIAFFADGALKKIGARGGAVVTLCAAPQGRGGSWAADDTIVFSPQTAAPDGVRLMRVSAAGGVPEPASTLMPGDVNHRWPQVLPGGDLLYTAHNSGVNFDRANLVVERRRAGAPRVVVRGGYFGRYVSTGHLLYVRDETLFAVPFDRDRLEMTGIPVPVIDQVRALPRSGAGHFGVAADGTLVYVSGAGTVDADPIHWITRAGAAGVLRAEAAAWMSIAFSPDGNQLAMGIVEPGQSHLSIYDIARDVTSRVVTGDETGSGLGLSPFWAAEGRFIAYTVPTEGKPGIFVRSADGTGPSHLLTEGIRSQGSWHPSGSAIVTVRSSSARYTLLAIPVERTEHSGWKAGEPQTIIESTARIAHPTFAPDGQWLAYHSLESGQSEVYVQPYRRPGAKVQISSDGGAFPTWSKARPEIVYVTDGRLMSVTFSVDGSDFRPERARLWSDQAIASRGPARPYDLHPDGERVAAALPRGQANEAKSITIVLNWFEDLKRRMARPSNP